MNAIALPAGMSELQSTPSFRVLHTVEMLKAYLLGRIPEFRLLDSDTWEDEAERLRRIMLDKVVLKGVPEEWRSDDLEIEWKEVIDTGKGYRIRKLTYKALPVLFIPALLYEPERLEDTTPGVLNLNGHVGPPVKAVDYKQVRCINLARRGMVALNPERSP